MTIFKSRFRFNRVVVFCFAISLTLLIGCRKAAVEGKLEEGQVAITFDDASIENWHNHLSLLDSLHIKATFYVSHYHTFNKQQKLWLKDIEAHGHEIAFHTATHADLAKEVAKSSLSKVEQSEIKTDLKMMQADGYTLTNFAYPFGSHTSQLDNCLLRTFKSVRALSNKQDYKKSLVQETGDRKVLYGANIDNNSRLQEDGIRSLMNDARDTHSCLVMVAHQINKSDIKLQITRDRLAFISKTAAERNLRFVTINEIAK